MEGLKKKETKNREELMGTDISVVITGGRGEVEVEEGKRGINSDEK